MEPEIERSKPGSDIERKRVYVCQCRPDVETELSLAARAAASAREYTDCITSKYYTLQVFVWIVLFVSPVVGISEHVGGGE